MQENIKQISLLGMINNNNNKNLELVQKSIWYFFSYCWFVILLNLKINPQFISTQPQHNSISCKNLFIYGLLNNAVSSSDYTMLDGKTILLMNRKRCGMTCP